MKKNSRPTYTEDQRIAAVAILLEHGGMTHTGLQLAREYLQSKVSTDTFHKWIKLYKDRVQTAIERPKENKQDIQIITDATDSALMLMERIRGKLLQQVDHYVQTSHDAVDKSSLQRIITSIAILQDKIAETTAMSAAMQAAIRPLAIACNDAGLNIYDLIADMTTTVQQLTPEQIEAYKNRGMIGN